MKKSKFLDNKTYKNINQNLSFLEWLENGFDNETLIKIFTNMDSSMKYLHDRGYYITSFNPINISFIGGSTNQVRFNQLKKLPDDYELKRNIIRQNIFQASFLHIGLYTSSLNCLSREFLKNNFSEFVMFLPENLVPYYRGIIERDASVYLNDYLLEKKKRDLAALEKDISTNENNNFNNGANFVGGNKSLIKSNGKSLLSDYDTMNVAVNNGIYKDLKNRNDNAFANYTLIHLLVLIALIFVISLCFLL